MFSSGNIIVHKIISKLSQSVRLILALLVFSHFVFAAPPISHGEEANAEALTQTLVSLNARYLKANASEQEALLSEMLQLAEQRGLLLADLIESNPGLVLRVALPEKLRSRMPVEVQALLEQNLELDGELEVFYEDHDDGTHRLSHFLKTQEGRVKLRFGTTPHGLLSGTVVNARGVLMDDKMTLESESNILTLAADGGTTGGSNSGIPAPLPNTFGEQRTLVMLVNFQDDPNNKPWTLAEAQALVFGTVSDFFYENSYQQTWLTGEATGWYTIPVDSASCDTMLIAKEADFAATASGIDLSQYTRRLYIFPYKSCGWSGVGTVGGLPSQAWINGKFELKTIGHELGHNFGIQHSHSLDCGIDTLGTNCQQSEYGDHFDIMGNFSSGQLNAFQKGQLGWLDYGVSPTITTVETSGVYVIEPYELTGQTANAIKILKDVDSTTGAKNWYYLEYRQAIGYDNFLANNNNVLNGVLVHLGNDQDRNSSQLLDMTPESNTNGWYDWEDTALENGMEYVDSEAGVTIYTSWTDHQGATVNVEYGTQPCVHTNPTLTFSPSESQWVTPGTAVDYSVSVTNNDNQACGASDFSLLPSPPFGWVASFAQPTLILEPGNTASTTFTVASPVSTADGFYSIALSVSNINDSEYTASGSVTYVVSTVTSNQAPLAIDDSAVTTQETPVTVAILNNDSDPDGDPLHITSFTQGGHGQVSIYNDGSINYLPDLKFKGDDNFTYSISDGTNSATANVVITVNRTSNTNGGGGKGGGKTGR